MQKKWLKSKFFIDISKACSTEGEEKNTRLQVRLALFLLKLQITFNNMVVARYETIPVSEEDEEIAPKAANYK